LINIFKGGKCNEIIKCGEASDDSCPASPYCIFVKNDSENNNEKAEDERKDEKSSSGKCILDECVIFSFEECSKNKSCGIIEGICKEIKNGSINGSISGPVIGG
jgi:hypothetical protein